MKKICQVGITSDPEKRSLLVVLTRIERGLINGMTKRDLLKVMNRMYKDNDPHIQKVIEEIADSKEFKEW
jgi:ABC-type Na+ transport system ATPase subunit NatA